jgi:hypothetical protein
MDRVVQLDRAAHDLSTQETWTIQPAGKLPAAARRNSAPATRLTAPLTYLALQLPQLSQITSTERADARGIAGEILPGKV